MSPDFGELRSLMQRPPDEDSWDRLCALIDQWPDERFMREALPYIEAHISRWDDLHRAAPWGWMERLMQAKPLPGLGLVKTLDLRSRRLRQDQIERILCSDWTDQLTQAYLPYMSLNADTLALLADHGSWRKLRILSLDQNRLGSKGPQPLHGCAWPALEELYLEGVFMGVQGFVAALDAPWQQTLHTLDASNFIFGAHGLPLRLDVSHIKRLYFNWVRPAPAAWATLIDWPWESLEVLSLEGRELSLDELGQFLSSPMAEGLKLLGLNWNTIGPTGAKLLAHASSLARLEGLDLRRNSITDEGARALMDAPWFGQLRSLRLEKNQLSAPMAQRLAAYEFVRL